MPNDFNKRLGLLFGEPAPPSTLLERLFSPPIPIPKPRPVGRDIIRAWGTSEGRDTICRAMSAVLTDFSGHRILRDLDYAEATRPAYDDMVSHSVQVSYPEMMRVRNPRDVLFQALGDLRESMQTHLMDEYYSTLSAALEEREMTVGDIAGRAGGYLLIKPSHERHDSFHLLRRYFDDYMYVVTEGLPWDSPLWTSHLGRMRLYGPSVSSLANPMNQSHTITLVYGITCDFPVPVYPVHGF